MAMKSLIRHNRLGWFPWFADQGLAEAGGILRILGGRAFSWSKWIINMVI